LSNPVVPEHIYEIIGVSEPCLSPDGSLVAFMRSSFDQARVEGRSQVMTVATEGRAPEALTHGPSDSSPKFSPDGASIAFIRPDDKGRRQLWTISKTGGEARCITSLPGGAHSPAWSPDSTRIAFVSDVDPDRLPDGHDPKRDPRPRVVTRIRHRSDHTGWRGNAFSHLFVVNVGSGETRQITNGEGDDGYPVWSPDGSRIAYITDRGDDRDTSWRSNVYVVPASVGEPELWSEGLLMAGAAGWSPDGQRLAIAGSDDPDVCDRRVGWVYVAEAGRRPRRVTDGLHAPLQPSPGSMQPAAEIAWTPDGRILFLGDHRGQSYLCTEGPDGGHDLAIGGDWACSSVSFESTGGKAVVAASTPTSPPELYLVDTRTGERRQLTFANAPWLATHRTAGPEKFTFRRTGQEIEYRLRLPYGFDPSTRYPLLLDIHGGPHGRFGDGWDSIQQSFAGAGYVVLGVNCRGSSSYGPEFAKLALRDWGGEDYRDIMAAVDEACERPYMDSGRLFVHGYSYGGFMSAWIVGHTDRFKAAVVGAPVANLVTMYATSDIGVSYGETNWGGSPMTSFETLVKHSPLTYAANVTTPVLLMHGEADQRCPIEQSEQYYVALKRLGKTVEFVRYPGGTHLFFSSGRTAYRIDYLNRVLGWFAKHLDGPGGARE